MMEFLSEFFDLNVMRLENFVILGEMLQDSAFSVFSDDACDHTNGAVDLCRL